MKEQFQPVHLSPHLSLGLFHCTKPGADQRSIIIIKLTRLADIVFCQRSSKIQSFKILQRPEACIYSTNVGYTSSQFSVLTCNLQRQIEPGIWCFKDPPPPPPKLQDDFWNCGPSLIIQNSIQTVCYRHDIAICNMHCRFEKCTWVLCWPLSWI